MPTPVIMAVGLNTDDRVATVLKYSTWRTQALALHNTEIYADMYAEYIAMGCSSSIDFFCADHPHYKLGRASTVAPSASSAVTQLSLVALQVAIEEVIDYASCIVEILNGIDFRHVNGFGAFLGWLFTVCALLNISMSAVMYIAPKPADGP